MVFAWCGSASKFASFRLWSSPIYLRRREPLESSSQLISAASLGLSWLSLLNGY
ncbi:unnamed protein product [Arabidopsis lyrata]|nr:unnamed protein product [Arabidopsis lyrata]